MTRITAPSEQRAGGSNHSSGGRTRSSPNPEGEGQPGETKSRWRIRGVPWRGIAARVLPSHAEEARAPKGGGELGGPGASGSENSRALGTRSVPGDVRPERRVLGVVRSPLGARRRTRTAAGSGPTNSAAVALPPRAPRPSGRGAFPPTCGRSGAFAACASARVRRCLRVKPGTGGEERCP